MKPPIRACRIAAAGGLQRAMTDIDALARRTIVASFCGRSDGISMLFVAELARRT
ncbi:MULTISPECIES: hypothetical protein [unclassified Bradyrhizobium]|uniref:hypothetical protein n=1 Tax=unclassified Bradyrhizobium TaxID=2631580 RepID=UPI00291653EA|nr:MULTISPECIES: hypothetical protein [unclassified Bradyrhizobium]